MRSASGTVAAAAEEAAVLEGRACEQALLELRSLVEADRVETARQLALQLVERWPSSPRVQYWARVLAPPAATAGGARALPSLERDQQWLRDHRANYPGCWIAVADGQLIAADPDLEEVQRMVRARLGTRGALLFHQANAGE
jgi:hypothetical protein